MTIVTRSGTPPADLGDDDLGAWWYREFVLMYSILEPRYQSLATWRVGQDLSKRLGSLLARRLAVLAVPLPEPESEPELIGAWILGRPVEEAPGQDFVTLEIAPMRHRTAGQDSQRPLQGCLLCGGPLVDHDDAACDTKMANWRPRGILAILDENGPAPEVERFLRDEGQ